MASTSSSAGPSWIANMPFLLSFILTLLAPTSLDVFSSAGLSPNYMESYTLVEIIVLDAPVSVVNKRGYPCTVPLMYIPSGSFLVILTDLITFLTFISSLFEWPFSALQASLWPPETACSSLKDYLVVVDL